MNRKSDNRSGIVVALFAGGVIGAGLALLFANNKGKEVQRNMINLYNKGKTRSKRITQSIIERGSEWMEDLDDNSSDDIDQAGGDIGYVIHEMLEEAEVNFDESPETK